MLRIIHLILNNWPVNLISIDFVQEQLEEEEQSKKSLERTVGQLQVQTVELRRKLEDDAQTKEAVEAMRKSMQKEVEELRMTIQDVEATRDRADKAMRGAQQELEDSQHELENFRTNWANFDRYQISWNEKWRYEFEIEF